MNWVRPPTIPAGAKIIAFHGKPNPPDAIVGADADNMLAVAAHGAHKHSAV